MIKFDLHRPAYVVQKCAQVEDIVVKVKFLCHIYGTKNDQHIQSYNYSVTDISVGFLPSTVSNTLKTQSYAPEFNASAEIVTAFYVISIVYVVWNL